ncbi:unnamed protein product [Brassicogethes aeneus]|uniref:Uncharacterized protein n=1 Tax=Brassicogethes aeneus TaxID=1431903 RepID=A0A9P0B2V9_BRAAE|nr:unnamed protein product [Brassicogethes aeneus]
MLLVVLQIIVIFFLVVYLYNRLTCGVMESITCLAGKTAIVTGGNSGIGLQVVKILASRGCRIIIADKVDSEKSKREVINETGNPNILTKHLDLSSFESIREFAADIKITEPKLDILVNNAGVGAFYDQTTKDGINALMQINYFGPFLLTHLLTDLLKKSSPSRIVFTSSCLAFTTNLSESLENFKNPETSKWSIIPNSLIYTYGNSKLATLIASDEIGNRLKGTGVTSNSCHPGACRTNIFVTSLKGYNFFFYFTEFWNFITSKTVWNAAQTTVHLATSKNVENITSNYFWDCKPFYKPFLAKNPAFCAKLFETTENIVGLKESEKIVKS